MTQIVNLANQLTPAMMCYGATASVAMTATAAGTLTVTTLPALGPAPQPAPAMGPAPEQWRDLKTPTLVIKFNGDLKELGFFLVHAWSYMRGEATEGVKEWCMTMMLEGPVAEWMVTLHNDDTPEQRNFECL